MKIKNIIAILGVVSYGLSLQSCSDFLTETNPNYLSTDNYYESLSDCYGGLNAVYNQFMSADNHTSALYENMRSDICLEGNVGRVSYVKEAYLQTFNSTHTNSASKWNALYKGIFRANQVLAGLDKFEPYLLESQQEEFDLIKAQAYFMRGLFYFWLNTTFNNGSVPYVDELPETEGDFYNSCLESDRIIALYRNDLNTALDLGLPESWSGADLGRVTSWAAKAILGKSYLYEENYDMARAYFKEIIESGQFELVEDIKDNFSEAGDFNKESLLEVSYSDSYNTEYGAWSTARQYNIFGMTFAGKGGWLGAEPPFWLVEEYEDYELVDTNNPKNWIEHSYDEVSLGDTYSYDVFYQQNEQHYGDEYVEYSETLGYDVRYKIDFVYTQLNNATDYDSNVYRRTTAYNNETGEKLSTSDFTVDPVSTGTPTQSGNPCYTKLYTSYLPPHAKWTIKWENGIPYRLRDFTPRASYSLALNGDTDVPYYKESVSVNLSFNKTSAYFRKHTNWETLADGESYGTVSMASSINFRFIRYADILLLYAECLIEGGYNQAGFNEALMYVNRVRERAGAVLIGSENQAMAEFTGQRTYQDTVVDAVNNTPADEVNPFVSDASSLMTHLMYKERPLELCIEGNAIRAIDLKRWGVTKERFVYLAQQKFIFEEVSELIPGTEDLATTLYDETLLLSRTANWGKQYRSSYDPTSVSYADYESAAINYGDNVKDWPIPSAEITTNPYINY